MTNSRFSCSSLFVLEYHSVPACLSLRSLSAITVASLLFLGVSSLRSGSPSMSFGSSSIIHGLSFSLKVTTSRNCSDQILNYHGGSRFTDAQNTGITISVPMSWAENPASCAIWYPLRLSGEKTELKFQRIKLFSLRIFFLCWSCWDPHGFHLVCLIERYKVLKVTLRYCYC